MTAAETLDTRAEWKARRRQGLGASDLPAILGLSPWASPFSVWADKSGLLPDEDDESDFMEFGRWAELMIGPWFTDRTGLMVAGEQMECTHPDEPWMRCTLDGLVFPDRKPLAAELAMADALGPLQIKTTAFGPRWEEIPAHIQAQEQWELHVTGMDRVWIAALHGRRLEIYELERDQADIDLMVERARTFWHDHVLAGEPPEVDGSDATARALAAIYPTATKGKAVDIDTVAGALEMLAEAKADAKDAEARESAAKGVLAWALKDAEVGLVAGNEVCTYKHQTRKTTCPDCGAVRESQPYRVLRPRKESN